MLLGKFTVITRKDKISEEIALKLKNFLLKNKMQEDETSPEYIFVVGGDGTVLKAFRKYLDIINKVKFLSIHTGHLGFYTDYQAKDYEKIFDDMLSKEPKIESYPLVAVEAYCKSGNLLTKSYALNEITLNNSLGTTYIAELLIDGEHFENFRGDGICISSPTGSTAYNKSLAGAVIHPGLDVFQVTEIAALNNLVYRTLGNSMILSKDEKLTIKPKKQDNNHRLSIDQSFYSYDSLSKIEVTLSKTRKISFIRYNQVSFWQRVKRSFIGE
ncbi:MULTISPECIES: NAD kinase [unclassified Gemella]|uniref:NAD kinase n=1 Tax=unclassified Gemella TaxID=2624949 RepID=UPI001C05DCFE|nr:MULTISPECIES: NAD kinase [unclassified Gemella]MBU0278895.1 NAD kinase [Gemella sp. zg-1178]QWQ38590.1 NAD kinase [Gemella sp. zg-570]